MLLFSVVQIIAKGPEPHSPQPIECAAASTLDQHSFDAAWAADWNGTDGTLSSPASERDCFKKVYQNWCNLFGRAKWPCTSQVFFPQLLFCFDIVLNSLAPVVQEKVLPGTVWMGWWKCAIKFKTVSFTKSTNFRLLVPSGQCRSKRILNLSRVASQKSCRWPLTDWSMISFKIKIMKTRRRVIGEPWSSLMDCIVAEVYAVKTGHTKKKHIMLKSDGHTLKPGIGSRMSHATSYLGPASNMNMFNVYICLMWLLFQKHGKKHQSQS